MRFKCNKYMRFLSVCTPPVKEIWVLSERLFFELLIIIAKGKKYRTKYAISIKIVLNDFM